jgi:hypothetical protein
MYYTIIRGKYYFAPKSILLFIGLIWLCLCCNGCASGYFKLDQKSRLPAWFHNTNNIPREKLDVEIILYEPMSTDRGKVEINISSDGKKIKHAEGVWWYHPKSLKKTDKFPPNWLIFEVNGVREIYEHKEQNDILKIVDNVDEKN